MGQHVLDGAGRRGNAKDEHQRETLDVPAVAQTTTVWNFATKSAQSVF